MCSPTSFLASMRPSFQICKMGRGQELCLLCQLGIAGMRDPKVTCAAHGRAQAGEFGNKDREAFPPLRQPDKGQQQVQPLLEGSSVRKVKLQIFKDQGCGVTCLPSGRGCLLLGVPAWRLHSCMYPVRVAGSGCPAVSWTLA